MKKIISLFKRNYDTDHKVRNEVVEGAEWVIAGEGVATRKYDGTCVLIENGKLFKRYEVKKDGTPPIGFIPANEVDPNTGKQQGWLPVGDGTDDKWHREAFDKTLKDGTYELVGPKINGNPESFKNHILVKHGEWILKDCPRDFEGIKKYLFEDCKSWAGEKGIEGIVWHHPDGRMVKIKKKDFNY